MTPYENDSLTTEEAFLPIFNAFVQSHSHLASITSEGVEPYFPFPFYYFVNEDGIYRVCDQEYSVEGNLLFSYPVGQQELMNTWNGQIGELGNLNVQQIVPSSSGEVLEERDEDFTASCTDLLEGNNKKRIKVDWQSAAFKQNVPDPQGQPTGSWVYFWTHEAQIKAQRKVAGIWWSDTRHIALAATGSILNRHQHPSIPVNTTWPVNFFKCQHADKIKQTFAAQTYGPTFYSDLNNFAFNVNITGTNRTTNCQTIQALCALNLFNN